MKLFYTLLLAGAALAVGLLTYRWGFDFVSMGPSRTKVAVKWTAPAARPDGKPLELKRMRRTQDELSEHAEQLRGAELYVDRTPRGARETYGAPARREARYTVCLVLSNGTRLEARSRQADWEELDQAMAGTVRECLDKYRELRRRHGTDGRVREILNF